MSSLTLLGDVSGSIVLDAPAVAGSSTVTLPTTGGIVRTTTTPGTILQVVQATTTSGTSSTSTTFVSTGFSASITPISSTSKVLVLFNGEFYNANSSANSCVATIYRNGSNILTSTGFFSINNNGIVMPFSCSYLDSPATTSATTYAIYQKTNNSAAGFWFLISGETATITLMEIAA